MFSDFGHPSGATLGLYSAILQIGAFSAVLSCKSLFVEGDNADNGQRHS